MGTAALTNLSTLNALVERENRLMTRTFYRQAIFPRLFLNDAVPDLMTSGKTKIDAPKWVTSARDRTGPTQDWNTGAQIQRKVIPHEIVDDPPERSNVLDYRARDRTPQDYGPIIEDVHRREVEIAHEDAIVAVLDAATLTTITMGSTTNFINPSGRPVTDAAESLIQEAVDMYITAMIRAEAIGPLSMSPIGGQVGGMWGVLPPELHSVFANNIRDSRYNEQLSAEVLRDGSVMGTTAYQSNYKRCMLYNSSVPPKATNALKWKFYLGMPAAGYFSPLPMLRRSLDPNYSSAPVHTYNLIGDYAFTITDPTLIRRVEVFQKA